MSQKKVSNFNCCPFCEVEFDGNKCFGCGTIFDTLKEFRDKKKKKHNGRRFIEESIKLKRIDEKDF